MLDRTVLFRVRDESRRWSSLRLVHEVPGAPEGVFTQRAGEWLLEWPRPRLQRLEYRLEARGHDGRTTVLCDEQNPHRAPSAFGDRSVLELPGYLPPWWLTAPQVTGSVVDLSVPGETEHPVPVSVWAPADTDPTEPLPLLAVHDGPEYDAYARITSYSAALVASGDLPPHRVALLHPVDRDRWYSGSPAYLRTLLGSGLDLARRSGAVRPSVVVMGASLGGLTALLAGLRSDGDVAGVFSQSGSFFQLRRDAETVSGFRHFGRIERAVAAILDDRNPRRHLRIGLTCGALEENAANNRDMAAALRRAGHDVTHVEVPDLHTYVAWRDALDPFLTHVLQDTWT